MAQPRADDSDEVAPPARAVVATRVRRGRFAPLARRIAEALDVSGCSIYAYQPRDGTVRAVAVWSRDAREDDDTRIGAVESLTDRWDFAAVLAQEAIVELHADSDVLDDAERDRMRRRGERATLTAPLAFEGEVIGLVSAVEERGRRRFTADERALFDANCQAAAMAIHADTLNRRLEDRNRQLALRLQERDRLARELQALSLHDDMTGLFNRRGFFTLAEQQFKLARRIGHRCTVAFVDVDGMKLLNDTWGHAAGDEALRLTAKLLEQTYRDADIIARLGGDEFVVLMVEGDDAPATAGADRLADAVASWKATAGREWSGAYSLSIGVADCPSVDSCDLDELIARADAAMYADKRSRRATRRRAG